MMTSKWQRPSKKRSQISTQQFFTPVAISSILRLMIRFGLVSLITMVLVLSWGTIAHSQLPSFSPGDANISFNPPSGVSRYGEYETASIKSPLDGKELFEVTSPTIFNRDKIPDGSLPVEVRAQEVNERLWRVFYRTYSNQQTLPRFALFFRKRARGIEGFKG